jgi:hypothetical protein
MKRLLVFAIHILNKIQALIIKAYDKDFYGHL